MDRRRRGLDLGPVIFGVALLFVGGYYVLRNTFGLDMQELDGDKVWPVIVIAIGAAVLVRYWTQLRSGTGGDNPS